MLVEPARLKVFLVLTIGLVSIAFGSIFVRLSQEAPSLVIAFFRMFWASVLLLPFYLRRRPSEHAISTGWHTGWHALAGIALALHFAFWVSSLRFTTVAVSVVLVNTSPILVALFSYLLFREKLTLAGYLGILLAFAGSILLFLNDLEFGDWRGASFSLIGALMLAVYLVAGRKLRQHRNLLEYVYPTYLLAALVLGALVWAAGFPLVGFSPKTHFFLFLLGLVPQCLGHTSYNWALKFFSATVVSTLILAEPILASVLAYWILNESIGAPVLFGAAAVAAGTFLVTRWGIRKNSRVEVAAAVLWRDGKVWIQKRHDTGHLDEYWEFPGGKIEAGESARQALIREIAEEVNIQLEEIPDQPLHIQEHSYPEREVRIHFFLLAIRKQPASSGRWVGPDELDRYRMPPANGEVIRKLQGLRQSH